jgi:hypothetical protein
MVYRGDVNSYVGLSDTGNGRWSFSVQSLDVESKTAKIFYQDDDLGFGAGGSYPIQLENKGSRIVIGGLDKGFAVVLQRGNLF